MASDRASYKCPKCKATLTLDMERGLATCPQCETTVSIGELILKEQARRRVRILQAVLFAVWLVATVAACAHLLVVVGGQNGLIGTAVVLLAGGLPVVLGGGYVVFRVIPEMLREQQAS